MCYTGGAERCKIDLTGTWTSLHKGSKLFMSKANSDKFKKTRDFGVRQYWYG